MNLCKQCLNLHNNVQTVAYKLCRNFAAAAGTKLELKTKPSFSRKMKGWQIHAYNEDLQLSDNIKIPMINTSNNVLVRVEASGINPIDVAMLGGYGATVLNAMRCNPSNIEFPLTFGREFAGIIKQKGLGTTDELSVGDQVWGVVPLHMQGSHSEYVIVPETCIQKKPDILSAVEASAVLYAGLTAWSGLFISGQLGGFAGAITSYGGGQGKRVLVLGASGGVGSIAVQILRAEDAFVVASCSTDAIPIVQSLGPDHIIDYTNREQLNDFAACGPYHIILDCAGQGQQYANQFGWKYDNYVTFSSPSLRNVDQHGLGCGMAKNIQEIIKMNILSLTTKQGSLKWGYFVPANHGIQYLGNLVKRKKLLPVIDSTFNFNELPEAYQKVKNGHLRGKVVVDFKDV